VNGGPGNRKPYGWIVFTSVASSAFILLFLCVVESPPDTFASYAAFFGSAFFLLSTFPYGFDKEVTYRLAFASLFTQAILFVLLCATIFGTTGLLSGETSPQTVDTPTAIYFSIVTFTTLGYGDFQPPPNLRLLAAFEAIMGYVVLGFVIGLTDDFLRNGHKSGAKYGLTELFTWSEKTG